MGLKFPKLERDQNAAEIFQIDINESPILQKSTRSVIIQNVMAPNTMFVSFYLSVMRKTVEQILERPLYLWGHHIQFKDIQHKGLNCDTKLERHSV